MLTELTIIVEFFLPIAVRICCTHEVEDVFGSDFNAKPLKGAIELRGSDEAISVVVKQPEGIIQQQT